MDQLWAPWRKAYIQADPPKRGRCLFCSLAASRSDASNLILARSRYSFSVLNRYPYNNGHLMVVPRRHVASIAQLSAKERLDWLDLYDQMEKALKKSCRPHGLNVGINVGRIAGAGVPGHLHLHVVPRWRGDVNFMPVIGQTKVISESLKESYRGIRSYLKKEKGLNR